MAWIIKIFKKFFTILFILASGCAVKNDKKDRADFEKLSKDLFSRYDYFYERAYKKQEADSSFIYVQKNKMSKKYFENNIKNKIIENGWREVPAIFDDQIIFCYGVNNIMSVVYPTKTYYRNEYGDSMSVKKENIDNWIINMNYYMYGIDNCKRN